MTYSEAVNKINSLLTFGVKPGLERIRELVDKLGAPDRQLRFVHVAGTNGKGSTCALIAAALTQAGYKTGRFISPYVLEFRERFMIDGEMIPEHTLAELVEEIFPVIEDMHREDKIITEFEFVFAIAVLWYAREGCDIVVLETGLGGRFDATNIINTPMVSVITSVSLDHTKILGNTYAEIAAEKCGIIKPDGICVAYAQQKSEVISVIRKTAAEKNNRLIFADGNTAEILRFDIGKTVFVYNGLQISIRLPGNHMVRNAVSALETLFALRDCGMDISNSAIRDGFENVTFPARMEVLSRSPLIILDGAHNPDGAKALSDAIGQYLAGKRKIGIVGMLADKDVDTALSCLIPQFDKIITVAPDNPRKMTAEALAQRIHPYCPDVTSYEDLRQAFNDAAEGLDQNSALVIFGSLYLASDMRKIVLENSFEENNANVSFQEK